MDHENIMFSKQKHKKPLGTKILIIIITLMLIKYYYLEKVIWNILLDIAM